VNRIESIPAPPYRPNQNCAIARATSAGRSIGVQCPVRGRSSACDPGMRHGGRADRVVFAGDEQRALADPAKIGRPRVAQRLAGRGIALRVLPHDGFAHIGDGERVLIPAFPGQRGLDHLVGDRGEAFRARPGRAGAQRGARGIRRLWQGAQQDEIAHQIGVLLGEMRGDDRAERMAGDARALGAEHPHRACDAVDEGLDRYRAARGRASRTGQIEADDAGARREARQHRGPHVRRAAQTVDKDDRFARTRDLRRHALDDLRAHRAPPPKYFASMVSNAFRNTSLWTLGISSRSSFGFASQSAVQTAKVWSRSVIGQIRGPAT
jgi:hypothetical protein